MDGREKLVVNEQYRDTNEILEIADVFTSHKVSR